MPIKVQISRPGYHKFRVADLGINIIEKNPKEYTIVENAGNSVRINPSNFGDRHGRHGSRPARIKIIILTQNIKSGKDIGSYLSFCDGKIEACIPVQFQLANALMSRVVNKSEIRSDIAYDKITSGGCELMVEVDDFADIVKAAERFGRVIENKRVFGKKYDTEDRVSCGNSKALRYLMACIYESLA